MEKLKYFFIKNKMKIIIALIIFICAIAISIGIFVQITDRDVINKEDEVQADYEDLKNNFDSIFTNSINIESSARQDINYEEIKGISLEARQKLNKNKPYSIGQASRISGVSPADISVLLIYLQTRNSKNE